jgi:glutamate--cysteine ligase
MLLQGMRRDDALALRAAVPSQGLKVAFRGGTLRDLAREVVAIARDGLRARTRLDPTGADETVYLAPLDAIVAGGPTQAEYWLARYRGDWHGDVSRIFAEAAI